MNLPQSDSSISAKEHQLRISLSGTEVWNLFHAPARVNLLGEHTDYTGGLVLPMAIPFVTRAAIRVRQNDLHSFSSDLFPEKRIMAFDDRGSSIGDWTDYPVGVLRQLQRRNIHPPAFELHFNGNVPFGAGLSSSASVEVASALAMLKIVGEHLALNEIAVLCRQAENEYVRSPCGIMDQFVIAGAKAGHALLLDTRLLTYEHLPMNRARFAKMCIVVCNSMVKHSVANGEYGIRRHEVESGQEVLRSTFPQLLDLGDATADQLESCKPRMPLASYLRCRHIISENRRVGEARQAILAGDPIAFGQLMLRSHASQRDDFACSCEQIDFLVAAAATLPGCFGSRLTGGGFGGCTVNLVERSLVEGFTTELKRMYCERFQMTAETYVCEAVDGALRRNAITSSTKEQRP